jgi:hypothetical protein
MKSKPQSSIEYGKGILFIEATYCRTDPSRCSKLRLADLLSLATKWAFRSLRKYLFILNRLAGGQLWRLILMVMGSEGHQAMPSGKARINLWTPYMIDFRRRQIQ